MPIVTIQQSPRSVEMKRELARRITDAFVTTYGVREEAVQIFFAETDHENWAKAGELACDRSGGQG
ncbi:tautomerase family protein [Billgrantia lactosivorans]|uniref:tautomerase family protein n=1 Tax=Billgrantia lactosivorans TaxID=2185141 RepID=UPI000DAD4438|nr:4-oxalocrotonate tautomerase family protein [Halomonas lactosivorans]